MAIALEYFKRASRCRSTPRSSSTAGQVPVSAVGAVRADGDALVGPPDACGPPISTSTPGRRSTTSWAGFSSCSRSPPRRRCSSCSCASDCGYQLDRTLMRSALRSCRGSRADLLPMVKAFSLGQIQVWINGLFAIVLLCLGTDRKATSGVLMGLICLIKPHYGLFVLWALLRKEWRFIIACVVDRSDRADRLDRGVRLRESPRLSAGALAPRRARRGLLSEPFRQRTANRIMSIWDNRAV